MTVKIDGVEPNIFPDVEDLDARDAGRNGVHPELVALSTEAQKFSGREKFQA